MCVLSSLHGWTENWTTDLAWQSVLKSPHYIADQKKQNNLFCNKLTPASASMNSFIIQEQAIDILRNTDAVRNGSGLKITFILSLRYYNEFFNFSSIKAFRNINFLECCERYLWLKILVFLSNSVNKLIQKTFIIYSNETPQSINLHICARSKVSKNYHATGENCRIPGNVQRNDNIRWLPLLLSNISCILKCYCVFPVLNIEHSVQSQQTKICFSFQ